MSGFAPDSCPFCTSQQLTPAFSYDAPPTGETSFDWAETYARGYVRCEGCGHFLAQVTMDLDALYAHDYVEATYGGLDGMRRSFERIIGLPPGRSDNVGRCAWVDAAVRALAPALPAEPTLLDVGAGLGVFPHVMRGYGWRCTALDTDARQAEHLRTVVGCTAIHGDFRTAQSAGRYDLITFNKVLEHVPDPIAMLRTAADYLAPDGLIYIELPDGEAAAVDGAGREEFFIEHYHVFSAASIALLATRAGFRLRRLERLQEPSTKYTLRMLVSR